MQELLDKYLDLKIDLIPKAFWDEISIFTNIIVSVSGGVDSSAVAIAFYNRGIKFSLLWNNTIRSMPESRATLTKIFSLGMPWNVLFPFDSQRLISNKTKKAFRKIVRGEIAYNKKSIPCCWYLKEKPLMHYFRKKFTMDTINISSIAGYESWQRQIRLSQLRRKNTYLRFKKKEQLWFGYPLRDFTKKKQRVILQNFLVKHNILGVKASACHTCPIVVLFEEAIIKEEGLTDRIKRSKKVFKK